MRKTILAVVCLFLSLPAAALEREPWPVFAGRRARLLEKLADGVTVLFAYTAGEGQSLRSSFRQESNFYYLTGWNEPGAVLMLVPPMKERQSPLYEQVSQMPRAVLYLPARNAREERWTGPKFAPYDEGLRDRTGFEAVRGIELFDRDLSQAVAGFGRIYTLRPRERAADREIEPRRLQTLEKIDRKSTRLNSSHIQKSRMPSSA